MSTSEEVEVAEAIKASLEKRGSMQAVKATLRAEIYKTLAGDSAQEQGAVAADPLIYLSFEIVKEFLQMTNMKNALDVLRDECGLRDGAFDREGLLHELGMYSGPSQVPILALLIDELRARRGVESSSK